MGTSPRSTIALVILGPSGLSLAEPFRGLEVGVVWRQVAEVPILAHAVLVPVDHPKSKTIPEPDSPRMGFSDRAKHALPFSQRNPAATVDGSHQAVELRLCNHSD